MFIPVAQWLPDQPPFNNPGGNRAFNVFPGASWYEQVPSMMLKATGPATRMLGVINARDQANNNYTYCGDVSALYVQAGGVSISSVTRANISATTAVAVPYTTANNDCWEFVQWGQSVLATNGTDTLQQINFGGTHFANVGSGSATITPKGRHIAVINSFVVLGNISDSATQVQRVRWSALNNVGSWTPDAATLADFQDLPGDGGFVQKIVGGEQGGYVFQERAIYQMNFVGSPLIFQFNKIQYNIGAFAAQSVINWENLVFFLAADGFYQFDGTNLTPIGLGRVDKTFFADLDTTHVFNIRAAIWPQKKVVMWAYPGAGNNGGLPNHILVYSWGFDRWTRIDVPPGYNSGAVDCIGLTATPGVTLEQLDAYCHSDIDVLMPSLDDLSWTGGNLIFSSFVGGQLYYFNGVAMSADVETAEINPAQQLYMNMYNQMMDNTKILSQLNEVVPIIDNVSQTAVGVAVASRYNITDAISYGAAVTPNATGFCEFRVTNRNFRFDITTNGTSNFGNIQGVDIQFVEAGTR